MVCVRYSYVDGRWIIGRIPFGKGISRGGIYAPASAFTAISVPRTFLVTVLSAHYVIEKKINIRTSVSLFVTFMGLSRASKVIGQLSTDQGR